MPRGELTGEDRIQFLLNCGFYATKVCKPPPEGTPALGETLAFGYGGGTGGSGDSKGRSGTRVGGGVAPSTRKAIEALCSSQLYSTRPGPLTMAYCGSTPRFYTAWHAGLQACHSAVDRELTESGECRTGDGVTFVDVATVEHDNRQLEWGREGVPLCAAGSFCAATSLVMNQGPLHAYELPSKSRGFLKYCLLCCRGDVEGMVMSVAAQSKSMCARVPVITPPFKNCVGPGGYDPAQCSVTPTNQSVFVGNVWIVRLSGPLQVRLNAETGKCYVDQGALVYRGGGQQDEVGRPFLGRGAAARRGSTN